MKKLLLLLFFMIIAYTSFSQSNEEKKKEVNVEIEFNSPRNIRIIHILLNRDDVYDFCDNFYNFYYTKISDTSNVYYIVEKRFIQDSIKKYNAIKTNSIELKMELLSKEEKEKVFIVPLH